MQYTYRPKGVCSREILITLQEDIVEQVAFIGGCDGNLKAISRVVKGMRVEEVEQLFDGIICGRKGTSCSAQLAKGVREAYESSK